MSDGYPFTETLNVVKAIINTVISLPFRRISNNYVNANPTFRAYSLIPALSALRVDYTY